MSRALTPGNGRIGSDPLRHMSFLIHEPERVLALRLALSRVITPTSVVLDAGCGSLGLLAIMAAKLGARRVVAVDVGGTLEVAKALAAENGVADRVQFVQGDLHNVQLPVDAFDVIVGMVYINEIKKDLAQQRLMAGLVQRFGHTGTSAIPNKVRYSVAGYDLRTFDRSDSTRIAEWDTHIENAERQVGMTFGAVRQTVSQGGAPRFTRSRHPLAAIAARWWPRRLGRPPLRRNTLGYFDRSRMTLLTGTTLFTEIDYARPSTATDYPATASLPITRSGQLQVVVWQQDLVFDDLLIRSTESLSVVDAPKSVAPGDTVILSTRDDWSRFIPLTVSREPESATPS